LLSSSATFVRWPNVPASSPRAASDLSGTLPAAQGAKCSLSGWDASEGIDLDEHAGHDQLAGDRRAGGIGRGEVLPINLVVLVDETRPCQVAAHLDHIDQFTPCHPRALLQVGKYLMGLLGEPRSDEMAFLAAGGATDGTFGPLPLPSSLAQSKSRTRSEVRHKD